VPPLDCKSATFGELTIRFGVFRVAENEEKVMVRETKIAQKGGKCAENAPLSSLF
jgi:hypothetical protein